MPTILLSAKRITIIEAYKDLVGTLGIFAHPHSKGHFSRFSHNPLKYGEFFKVSRIFFKSTALPLVLNS